MLEKMRPLLGLVAAVALMAVTASPAHGRVEVTVDAATLQDLLAVAVPPALAVALPGGLKATVRFEELRVLSFEPGGGRDGRGLVRTSARVSIPELGWSATVQPRLALHVEQGESGARCRVRFEELKVPLPVVGTRDIGAWLPPLGFPAEQVSRLETERGPYRLETRLTDVAMGARGLRFGFDVKLNPLAETP